MGNVKEDRIRNRKSEAETIAKELGHKLGKWEEIKGINIFRSSCVNVGCSATVRVGTSRKGTIIDGDIIGTTEWPARCCLGR